MPDKNNRPTQLSEHETREGAIVNQVSAKPEPIITIRPQTVTTNTSTTSTTDQSDGTK
jgi:hypothetical protein